MKEPRLARAFEDTDEPSRRLLSQGQPRRRIFAPGPVNLRRGESEKSIRAVARTVDAQRRDRRFGSPSVCQPELMNERGADERVLSASQRRTRPERTAAEPNPVVTFA